MSTIRRAYSLPPDAEPRPSYRVKSRTTLGYNTQRGSQSTDTFASSAVVTAEAWSCPQPSAPATIEHPLVWCVLWTVMLPLTEATPSPSLPTTTSTGRSRSSFTKTFRNVTPPRLCPFSLLPRAAIASGPLLKFNFGSNAPGVIATWSNVTPEKVTCGSLTPCAYTAAPKLAVPLTAPPWTLIEPGAPLPPKELK